MKKEQSGRKQRVTEEVNQDSLSFMDEFALLDEEMTHSSTAKPAHRAPRHRTETRKRKPASKAKRRKPLTGTEKSIIAAGIAVALLGLALGSVLVEARRIGNAVRAFHSVGTGMEGIALIGEEGITAVELAAYEASLNPVREETEEKIDEKNLVKIEMTAQTIKGDLKIKFIDKETGRLVEGVPFAAKVTDPDKVEARYVDDDKNGIIYLENIKPGSYRVENDGIEGDSYKKYKVLSAKHNVAVSDVLAYQAIDVSDEVKDQSEVNAAQEDNMDANDTPEEAKLVNTVEFVESTKTLISGGDSYRQIDKSTINDPYKTAMADPSLHGYRYLAEIGTLSVTITGAKETIEVGEQLQLGVSVEPPEAAGAVTWVSSDNYAVVDANGLVTGTTGGGASTVTVTVAPAEGYTEQYQAGSATVTISVNAPAVPDVVTMSFGGNKEVTVGATGNLGLTVSRGGVVYTVIPQDVIGLDESGNFTALKPGEATVTATSTEDANVSATCNVKVKAAAEKVNDNAELKDRDGNQVYVKNGTDYRRAVNSDYASAGPFFVMTHSTEIYRYTGFQTIGGKTYYYDRSGNKVTGDHVIGGVQYKFDADGAMVQGSGARGIDVSEYNGAIDWAQVKAAGIEFAIIRLGYRGWGSGVLVEDARFRQNIQGALNNGIRVGVYFVTQAVNEVEAVEEASMVLGIIRNYSISYPVFLDVETSGGKGAGRADSISVATRTAVCRAFCQTVANSGYRAGVYANKNWLDNHIDTPQIAGYNIWMAQYYTEPTYRRTKFDMWQHTSSGSVPGIGGRVDMNISYTAY